MKIRDKIIYIAPSLSSFAKNDIKLLSKKNFVITNIYNWQNKPITPLYLIHQFFFILWHIFSTKKIFITFGGYWSFFPSIIGKIFNVDVYIILNGTDSAYIPAINYGSLNKFPLSWFCKQSYKFASILLPVSASLVYTKNTYLSDDKYSFQGYKHFFPNIKTESKVVYNGIDEKFWKPIENVKREENSFISVFSGNDQLLRKGGDLIIKLAERMPNCKFYLIGLEKPADLISKNTNLFFISMLKKEELRNYYNKAQFYFQLSIFEGFGVALAEAMLCECIPIGSSVNAIPEIIDDSGFILPKKDILKLETLVRKALLVENKKELQVKARTRIIENYSTKQREESLLSLL